MSISAQLGERRKIELPQGRITYRDRGSGEPIVFVHGVLVNGDLWRGVVDGLADRYRCITPDWPLGAHPEPMNADADLTSPGLGRVVADFLAALSLDDVTLVGNDTGGATPRARSNGHRCAQCPATSSAPAAHHVRMGGERATPARDLGFLRHAGLSRRDPP